MDQVLSEISQTVPWTKVSPGALGGLLVSPASPGLNPVRNS